jgi:hypothetical protein
MKKLIACALLVLVTGCPGPTSNEINLQKEVENLEKRNDLLYERNWDLKNKLEKLSKLQMDNDVVEIKRADYDWSWFGDCVEIMQRYIAFDYKVTFEKKGEE